MTLYILGAVTALVYGISLSLKIVIPTILLCVLASFVVKHRWGYQNLALFPSLALLVIGSFVHITMQIMREPGLSGQSPHLGDWLGQVFALILIGIYWIIAVLIDLKRQRAGFEGYLLTGLLLALFIFGMIVSIMKEQIVFFVLAATALLLQQFFYHFLEKREQ